MEIAWVDDAAPAAWWADGLDRSYDLVSALMPGEYEAYCRVLHRDDPEMESLPRVQARRLIEVLRTETTTPDRCWFCVSERRARLDDQGVDARVALPSGGNCHLVYPGSIDDAIAQAPAQRRGASIALRPGLTVEEIARRLRKESGSSTVHFFHKDATPEQIVQSLAAQPHYLPEAAANFWWPDDRAWFVSSPDDLATTYVGGTQRLIDRLLADPRLAVRPAQLSDSLRDAEADAELSKYGPVIASGTTAGHTWHLRGRIDDDGVWSFVDGGGAGGGSLPFQDDGWKKTAHFGSVGWSYSSAPPVILHGVVSKQATAVEVKLTNGAAISAQVIDTGDRRASFFVAAWPAGTWDRLIARDATGAELETYQATQR
jgi:hypothetical protein